MYLGYFGLDSPPFSIVPDHRALYMSQSHREAVAHLLFALNQSGGFVQLTGEVGTGKTTVSRYILANLPDDVDVALLLNPRITEKEMLEAICDELKVDYPKTARQKDLITYLNDYLLKAHAGGRKTVLIIDEAQNLSREVMEQVRLLTNLETSTDKLLQIILIGQPELAATLQRHDLRQLSQRIVGRFVLEPLDRGETTEYIEHRLAISGSTRPLFTGRAISRIHTLSKGIPRLINVLCDRALLGAFGQSKTKVDVAIVNQAGKEVLNELPQRWNTARVFKYAAVISAFVLAPVIGYKAYYDVTRKPPLSIVEDSPSISEEKDESATVVTDVNLENTNSATSESGSASHSSGQKEAVGVADSDKSSMSSDDALSKSEYPAEIQSSGVEANPMEPGVIDSGATNENDSEEFDLMYRLGVPLKDRGA